MVDSLPEPTETPRAESKSSKTPSLEDRASMGMAATYQVSQPGLFDFSSPEEWPKWLRRLERFHQASGLSEKSEEAQVNTLIYCMGDQADDILHSFKLSVKNAKKYDVVKEKFQEHYKAPERYIRKSEIQ